MIGRGIDLPDYREEEKQALEKYLPQQQIHKREQWTNTPHNPDGCLSWSKDHTVGFVGFLPLIYV